MHYRFTQLRRSAAILALVLAGALVIALGPAGILADEDEAPGIDQFQPITISEQTFFELEALANDLDPLTMVLIYMELQDLGELESDVSKDSLREVGTLDDVVEHLDVSFRTPSYLPDNFAAGDATYKVSDSGRVSYTFDVAKARRISELLEIPTEWLPDPSVHSHLTVALDVPESGLILWENGAHKLVSGQIGIPHLDVPEELDLESLRDAILSDLRMPDELREQLSVVDDWDRTLPVPVPEGAEYREIVIDGVDGILVSLDEGSAAIWETDGQLHFVAGTISGDELERIAHSME